MGITPYQPQAPAATMGMSLAAPQQGQIEVMDEAKILSKYGGKIEDLLRRHVLPAFSNEKMEQYTEIRRNHLYLKGKQNLILTSDNRGWIDYLPVGDGLQPASDINQDTAHDYDTGLYQADVRRLIAVLGQRSPNIHATAFDAEDQIAAEAAKVGQKAAAALHYIWQADKLNRKAVGMMATDGPVFWYTPYVTDGKKYGTSSEPNYEFEMTKMGPDTYSCPCGASGLAEEAPGGMCPMCGSPAQIEESPSYYEPREVGSTEYENGCVECHIYSGMFVTIPMDLERFEDTDWLFFQREKRASQILAAHPEIEGKFSTTGQPVGFSEDQTGAQTRRQVASYSGRSYSGYQGSWLYSMAWFEPSMYFMIEDKECRAIFQTYFPDGMQATFVNRKLVKLRNECLFDVWTASQPEDSTYFWTQPYLNRSIEFQELINNLWTFTVESAERSNPITILDSSLADPAEIQRRGATVGGIMLARKGAGSFRDKSLKLDAAEINPHMAGLIQAAQTFDQDNNGLQPTIYGAEGKTKTAREAELQRNQALLSLNPIWQNLRGGMSGGWARATRNGAMQLAKHSLGIVHIPRTNDKIVLGDMRALLDGGVRWEAEESMPMTAAQVRDFLLELADANNPEIPNRLGLWDSENLEVLANTWNIPAWKIPQVMARRALLKIIRRLSEEAPPPPPLPMQDPVTGMMMPPPPATPSIPPDPAMFDPLLARDVCRGWLWSEEAEKVETQNPAGYENVRLYCQAWEMLANPPIMPPEGGGGEPPGGQPGPSAPAPEMQIPDPGQSPA